MKKSLKTLVVSLLSANFIVGSMATIVMAEEGGTDVITNSDIPTDGGETGGDTGGDAGDTGDNQDPGSDGDTSDPGETENPGNSEDPGESENPGNEEDPKESDESDESDSSESEEESESEESSEETPNPTVPTYPVTPPGSYVPPRTVPRTQVPSSNQTTETTIASQFDVTTNLDNLTALLASSLEDSNFALAWEDYQTLIADFDLTDISANGQVGSTFEEIIANFTGNAVPEQTTTEDGQNVLVFTYGEAADEESTPVQIVLIGDESGNVIGSALLQASNTQSEKAPVNSATAKGFVDKEVSDFYEQEVYVTALYQLLYNDVTYTTLVTPSETEGSNEFITLDKQFVLAHNTVESAETSIINQMQDEIASYIDSLINPAEETETDTDSETDETTEESTTEEQETEEESETEVAEEEPTVNRFVRQFAPIGYEELSLSDPDTLIKGYEKLLALVDGTQLIVTSDQLAEMFNAPSKQQQAGESTYYEYYSVEDDRVILLKLQINTDSNSVTSLTYDIRTPQLEEDFKINIDGLFELASNDLTMENVEKSIGKANLIEHIFGESHTKRHVWTSYTDPEMRNIEVYEDVQSGALELYYYDQK